MKQKLPTWLLAILLLFSGQASAQNGVTVFFKKLGTLLDTMSVRGVDRRYIDATKKPWQLIVRGQMNQGVLNMKANGDIIGIDYSANTHLKTEPSRYVGLWAGYRGYGLGYTVNVGSNKGRYLTFGATGGAYGANVRIHTFENYTPELDVDSSVMPGEDIEVSTEAELKDPIKVRTVIADGYYLFNGKRFSYAAAYDQSVLQKRSAGSFMAGAMYYYGHVNYATHSNGDLIYMMSGLGRVKLWQGSVGVGYAYNWVPMRGLLVSAMAMPMLTFVNRIKTYVYETNIEQLMADPTFWRKDIEVNELADWVYDNLRVEPVGDETYNCGMTVNFDGRLSLTYNFGNYFVNAYGQFNNMRYRYDNSHGYLNEWFVNASFGVRL